MKFVSVPQAVSIKCKNLCSLLHEVTRLTHVADVFCISTCVSSLELLTKWMKRDFLNFYDGEDSDRPSLGCDIV